jgi:prevent-host-death family protein
MIKIGVRELKNQLSQILQKVRDEGEVVEITYYGQRIAHLVPASSVPQAGDDLKGILSDLDSLAAEIGAAWEGDSTAIEAVQEVRREI